MFPFLSIQELTHACSYRCPMLVRELMVFPARSECYSYYVCPRCQITMEREFMRYCDRCGQCLNWSQYERAKIIYPGSKQRGARAKHLSPI